MGSDFSCHLNCCTSRQKDEESNMLDFQNWVLAEDNANGPKSISSSRSTSDQTSTTLGDNDCSLTSSNIRAATSPKSKCVVEANHPAEHVSLQETGKDRTDEAAPLLAAAMATRGSHEEIVAQPGEATSVANASTNASAAKEPGSQGLSQVKEEGDCDTNPEPLETLENQDLLPHWYSSPEIIACKKSIFSTTCEEKATTIQPTKDRTLSSWYGEQAGVELGLAPPADSNPNQNDFPNPGQALCHYHDLCSFKEESDSQTTEGSFMRQPVTSSFVKAA